MDFIKQLPASEDFSAILVVIDHLMKQVIFIPSHDTVNALQAVQLFLTHVFSKHGVPSHVTSDQGSEFILHFFCSLGKLLQMRLHFTSGYHPEGDGQMECTNQVLEQYLQVYTNYQQDDWVTLLPMAEFTYNNITNVTTGGLHSVQTKDITQNSQQTCRSKHHWLKHRHSWWTWNTSRWS